MRKAMNITALSATFLATAAAIGLTWINPEEPNFIGKAFFLQFFL